MVRGEIRIPIFNRSSFAIGSSPQVQLFVAISAINFRTATGTRGRPLDRDFHFQNKRNPFRCQRIRVSGFTTNSASRHSKNLESLAIVKRIASLARRGFCFRSTYRASCLRRNKFSAASVTGERRVSWSKLRTSKEHVKGAPHQFRKSKKTRHRTTGSHNLSRRL